MEPKKNPKIDPGRNSSLYFSLGLICALSVSYAILQTAILEKPRVADASPAEEEFVFVQQDFDKKIKILPTEVKKTQILTDKIKVVKVPPVDAPDKPILDEPLEPGTNDGTEDPGPLKAKDIPTIIAPPDEPEVSSWIGIEEVPIFPGCEKLSKDQHRKCFEAKLRAHIEKHQRFPQQAFETGLSGSVKAQFIIDETGQVVIVAMRGTHPMFEKEVQRVLNLLPKMTAGKQGLKAVKVSYALPFSFKVQN
jgi:protein TonB